MKKLLTALTLACAALSATAEPLTFIDGTASFDEAHGYTPDLIIDEFTFNLDKPHEATVAAISIALFGDWTKDFDFTKISLIGPSKTFSLTPTTSSTDFLETWSLEGAHLSAGHYTLRIEGHVPNNARSGSYGGNINVSPLPEPGTIVLLALGLVGIIATRRRA